MHILALDPGFGNTKVCLDGVTAVLQSAISHPRPVGMAAVGLKTTSQAKTIRLGEYEYAIGNGAWHWGEPLTSRDYSAITSPERRALALATLAEILEPGEHTIDTLVIGLPVELLQDESQAQALLASLRAYKDAHRFSTDRGEYLVTITRLKALAQPVGAYADWLLDDGLRIRRGGRKAEAAVLDLGLNTLDLFAIQDGRVAPRFVGGGKVGVRRLLELLARDGRDSEELDADLRCGRLKPDRSQLDSWLGEVLAAVERIWPGLRRFQAVIPTGGGALLLGELLQAALAARGAALFWPENPVTANVRGLWKWGAHGVSRPA